jgi:hypothetical protein
MFDFFESFVPLWVWQKKPKAKKKGGNVITDEKAPGIPKPPPNVAAKMKRKSLHATVEDASDDEIE